MANDNLPLKDYDLPTDEEPQYRIVYLISVRFMFKTSTLISLFHKKSLQNPNFSSKSKKAPISFFLHALIKNG